MNLITFKKLLIFELKFLVYLLEQHSILNYSNNLLNCTSQIIQVYTKLYNMESFKILLAKVSDKP